MNAYKVKCNEIGVITLAQNNRAVDLGVFLLDANDVVIARYYFDAAKIANMESIEYNSNDSKIIFKRKDIEIIPTLISELMPAF